MNLSIQDLQRTPYDGRDAAWLLRAQAEFRHDHPFVVWAPFAGPSQTWTYAKFAHDVARVAAGLYGRGVREGDRVLIHLDNCPETILSWFACGWMGAVAVTTNTRSSVEELAYFWTHSGAVGVISQPRYADAVGAACANASWAVFTDSDGGEEPAAPPPAAMSFARLDADPQILPPRIYDPRAAFCIQYTSGTTSRPKAVLWTHANALWGAQMNAANEGLRPDDIHLVTMPLFHTNAQSYSVLATLWAGATCVVQPRFSASNFWAAACEFSCTWASMVPFCTRALMAHEPPKSHSFRLWGNAGCDPPTDDHFGVRTLGSWGMTETVSHGLVGSAHLPNHPLSVGRPAAGYQVRVTDEDGRPTRAGDTGELFIQGVRGLSLFAEYYRDPTATVTAFTVDGFFITGDRLRVEADGSMTFADRAKDMLKVGGESVAASEIERVIGEVPGVAEVAVVGRPDTMLDEVPVAFVIPGQAGPESGALVEAVTAACRTRLAAFKVPREVRLVSDLPRSTLEKVAKVRLRESLLAPGGLGDNK